jgi:hypothetical protein
MPILSLDLILFLGLPSVTNQVWFSIFGEDRDVRNLQNPATNTP